MQRKIEIPGISIPALFFFVILTGSNISAQNMDELGETLFARTNKILIRAQSEQASILSPTKYKNAINKFEEAQNDFQEGKALKNIKKKLTEVRKGLEQCLEVTKVGKVTFNTTLKAREDALKTNAPEFARISFEKAEKEFNDAAKKLERGDVKNAKKSVPEIDKLYRNAELIAIKESIVGNVQNLISEARKEEAHKFTPITFANAQKLLNEAEAILNSNRRSVTGAKSKAEAAEIEAKHAIFLTRQIKRLKKNQHEWENFVLDREILIEDIARELGFNPNFDEGLDKPLKRINKIAQSLQKEKKELIAYNNEKDKEIQQLSADLQKYKEKEQGLQAELQENQYKLEMKRQHEDKIKSLETMFAQNEAIVLRKANDIIFRLIGLTFPSGKATIEPEFFSLLTTVQRAIRKFPNSSITIEGHTDAVGDDRFNENLSYERAMAVKQYLLANMGMDESRITALGYGENKPIASNETTAGKAQNRRIDIVLTFGEGVL